MEVIDEKVMGRNVGGIGKLRSSPEIRVNGIRRAETNTFQPPPRALPTSVRHHRPSSLFSVYIPVPWLHSPTHLPLA